MPKPKQFARPGKKQNKAKAAPESANDFQEAADAEEDTGGKWRAGDPAKSGRAFVRALDIYDQGLARYPTDFDLAYNKARLQYELSQQPALVSHLALPLVDLLQQTLTSHRHALKINDDYADLLFNTSQVLTSLAEQYSEHGEQSQAVPLLHEALELLSSCLAKQEMSLEQQQLDMTDADEVEDDDGGISLSDAQPGSSSEAPESEERMATVVSPVTPNDLLDTVHASLSALTTLVPLVEQLALSTVGDMAHSLTEVKAPAYISALPADEQAITTFTLTLNRANFIAAYANAQYSFHAIELATYIERLQTFEIPDKTAHVDALASEAEARTELVPSVLEQAREDPSSAAQQCWKQLSLAQELLTHATKISSEEAKERKAKIYASKGDAELLRFRLATSAGAELSQGVRSSAPTLLKNAATFYKGAVNHAKSSGDDDVGDTAVGRLEAVNCLAHAMNVGASGSASTSVSVGDGTPVHMTEQLSETLLELADEGLVDNAMVLKMIESIT